MSSDTTVLKLLQFIPYNMINNLKRKIDDKYKIKSIDYIIIGQVNNNKLVFVKSYTNNADTKIYLTSDFSSTGQLFYLTNNCYGKSLWLPCEGVTNNNDKITIIKSSDKFVNNPKLLKSVEDIQTYHRFIDKHRFMISLYLSSIEITKNKNIIENNENINSMLL